MTARTLFILIDLIHTTRRNAAHVGVLLGTLVVAGCASIGPMMVPRDRVDYMTAVGDFLERADAPQYRAHSLW